MVFNSVIFIVFFAVVWLALLILQSNKVQQRLKEKTIWIKQCILLSSSYVFYGWWDWRFTFLMLGLTLTAYACTLMYERTQRRFFAYISFAGPLVVLAFFKYFDFFVSSFAELFQIPYAGTLKIILPVGISFYTFQSLSYSIDVYRKKMRAERSFLRLALYISFFPQLVAGPIVKAQDFLPQLYEDRRIRLENCERGIVQFVFGLFKKIVIADNLSVCVDAVFNAPRQYHAISLLFAVIAYSLQVYCDFSGYSDMAIGCAGCLGYDLRRNFNLPYLSKSVSEFWKRWHISLSSWLQEYLYIPLGGNRKGTVRTFINLFITMLLGGLWHGASWTFVAWGALHGAALCIHKIWAMYKKKCGAAKNTLPGKVFSVAATYAFVCLCWIFFRAEDFATAWRVIHGIFCWQNGVLYISTWTILSIVVIGVAEGAAIYKAAKLKTGLDGFYPELALDTVGGMFLLFVVLGMTFVLAYTGGNPFIYFQF